MEVEWSGVVVRRWRFVVGRVMYVVMRAVLCGRKGGGVW